MMEYFPIIRQELRTRILTWEIRAEFYKAIAETYAAKIGKRPTIALRDIAGDVLKANADFCPGSWHLHFYNRTITLYVEGPEKTSVGYRFPDKGLSLTQENADNAKEKHVEAEKHVQHYLLALREIGPLVDAMTHHLKQLTALKVSFGVLDSLPPCMRQLSTHGKFERYQVEGEYE